MRLSKNPTHHTPPSLLLCPSSAHAAHLDLQPHALLRHLALAQRMVHEVGAEEERGRDVEAEHWDQRLEEAQLGACGRAQGGGGGWE